jgi:uncharacterized protein YlaI
MDISQSTELTAVEDIKEYTCQECKRRKARWICLITQESGQQHVRLLCPLCSFITVPQRQTTIKFELLKDLLPSHHHEAPECESGLLPTGQASLLKSLEEEPRLLGLWIEMVCPKCGFTIDVKSDEVKAAGREFLHPNKKYNAEHKKPKQT